MVYKETKFEDPKTEKDVSIDYKPEDFNDSDLYNDEIGFGKQELDSDTGVRGKVYSNKVVITTTWIITIKDIPFIPRVVEIIWAAPWTLARCKSTYVSWQSQNCIAYNWVSSWMEVLWFLIYLNDWVWYKYWDIVEITNRWFKIDITWGWTLPQIDLIYTAYA